MGIVSDFYLKDPTDPQWKDDPGFKDWTAFMDKYYPGGDKTDVLSVYGPALAQTLVQVFKQCGDDLSRENIMKEAANLHHFREPMLLPGLRSTPARPISRRSSRSRWHGSTASTGSRSAL